MYFWNSYSDLIEHKNEHKNKRINVDIYEHNIEFNYVLIFLYFVCILIVWFPIYFSGYSETFGGLKMKLIDIVIKDVCEKTKWEYILTGGPINSTLSYTIRTGYSFNDKNDCLIKFNERYITGNVYKMYYNKIQKVIYTQKYALMLSYIGFIGIVIFSFFILINILFIINNNLILSKLENHIEQKSDIELGTANKELVLSNKNHSPPPLNETSI